MINEGIAAELVRIQARIYVAKHDLRTEIAARDLAIRVALREGATQRELADLLDVAPSRIAQIATAAPGSPGGSRSSA